MNTLPDEVREDIWVGFLREISFTVWKDLHNNEKLFPECWDSIKDGLISYCKGWKELAAKYWPEEYAKAYAPVPGKEEFKWTDELVKNYAEGYRFSSSRLSIELFKKDKWLSQESVEENYKLAMEEVEPKAVQQAAKEYEQDFKELNIYLNDIYHNHIHNVKDAGNLWIQFTDKFNAFKKKLLAGASFNSTKNEIQQAHDKSTYE